MLLAELPHGVEACWQDKEDPMEALIDRAGGDFFLEGVGGEIVIDDGLHGLV